MDRLDEIPVNLAIAEDGSVTVCHPGAPRLGVQEEVFDLTCFETGETFRDLHVAAVDYNFETQVTTYHLSNAPLEFAEATTAPDAGAPDFE
jgi:hypothetical protein